MDVFGKGTDEPSRPLLPPGTCWICDSSPTQEAEKVIDTRRNARPGGPTVHESVRKYICEGCAVELGLAVGMVPSEEHAELKQAHADAEFDAIALRERLEAAEAGQLKVVDVREVTAAIMPMLANLKSEVRVRATSGKSDVPPPVE